MFRNGFNATRRSLLTFRTAHSASKHSSGRPVKKGRGTKSNTFLGAIKRLEAHVQHIEKTYADRVKQYDAQQELPDVKVTDDLTDRAYRALMAPPQVAANFLPEPETPLDHLPAPALARIDVTTRLMVMQGRQELNWDTMLAEIELNGGLENMNTSEVNKMVSLVNVDQRAALSSKLLGMMESSDVQPNTLTFDLMMLAHAAVGNPTEVKTLFEDMKKRGLTPTVYSYGHLLKAHSQQSDVQAATNAIQEMHALGIIPNLVVYTTLIQTCINRNQLETAWQIFNLIKLKSASTAPDAETYTLMIHACAINGEVERALDLYTDMTTRRGLEPTHETYHALIHACALRKDYFTQAWRFATEMQARGLKVNRLYLNTLLQACGRTGELTRARLLVRHMMRSARTGEDLVPDEISFQNLLRAYAMYKAPGESKNRGVKGILVGGRATAEKDTEKKEEEATFIVTGSGRLEKRQEGQYEEKVPFLEKSVLLTHKEVMSEVRQVFSWIRENRPEFVSSQLLNAYLEACQNIGSRPGFREVKKCYSRYFSNESGMAEEESSAHSGKAPVENEETISDETAEEDEEDEEPQPPRPPPQPPRNGYQSTYKYGNPPPPPPPSPPRYSLPPRNIYTFSTTLQAAYKDRDLAFARRVMADRERYKRTISYQSVFPEEQRKHDFHVECIMIDILAACEYLGEAVERLEENLERFEWKEEHLKTLYTRAVQLEDWGTVRLCNKISGKEDDRF
ncbi:uncharacterized protein LAJ45_04252 [Morchella importuna]|uniref:uncharacterized protein n=1 Tax=Morchella importuna TaxID=1174673 RepID=UPI001E8E3DAB|nr:uncharacterized protein LAJ45_04252 [Morchella importuna]KAH8151630.1 hypothetical protein LAJ45_04252 [Morchella importuna]